MPTVNIKYQDSQNWTNINSQVINWDDLRQLYKDSRVEPAYLAPEIVTDIWNGKKHDVQHIRWGVWQLEIIVRESELQEVQRLQSCDTILIEDIGNGLNHTVDMQVSEWLNFSEPERVANTSNWKIILIYRTNKTPVNKFVPLDSKVVLIGGSGTYNSKYEKLSYDGELEEIRVPWGEGGEKLLQETNNVGFKVLLYLSDSAKEAFKNDWNQSVFTIDGTDIIRRLPLEIAELGEDNYQVIVSCITERETINSTLAMDTVSTLVENYPTGSSYASKFEQILFKSDTEKITGILQSGLEYTLREKTFRGRKSLYYFTESELDVFHEDWLSKPADEWAWFSTGGSPMFRKLPLDIEEMASGLYKVIVPFYTGVGRYTHSLHPNNLHNININSGTIFYTDSPIIQSYQDTDLDQFSNEGGVNTTAKAITRQVNLVKLYLGEADTYNLKQLFEKSTDITLNSVTVLENRIVSEAKLDYDLYEINIQCLIASTVANPL